MNNQLKIDAIKAIRSLLYSDGSMQISEAKEVADRLQASLNYKQVTAVHLDDLRNLGFLPVEEGDDYPNSHVTNLERIASKLSDDYCEQLFHLSLESIAKSENVYHSKQAIETLANLCEDLSANYHDGHKKYENLKVMEAYLRGVQDVAGIKNEDYILSVFDRIVEELVTFNDKEMFKEYNAIIVRLKNLIEWAN